LKTYLYLILMLILGLIVDANLHSFPLTGLYIGILFIAGIYLLMKSSDIFVDAAVKIAEVSGIPKIIFGATVVSLVTTLPELFVSITALLDGQNEMAIGNAIGSITFNTAVILSGAALFMSGRIERKGIIEKALIFFPAFFLLILFAWDLKINRIEGSILLLMMVVFLVSNGLSARNQMKLMNGEQAERAEVEGRVKFYIIQSLIIVFGAIGIRYGASFLVNGAVEVAVRSGLSAQVIGLTILAVGTSLPELATTISAIIKKEQSLSVGNILGANILNITLILGLSAVVSSGGLVINVQEVWGFAGEIPQTLFIDIPFAILISALFFIPIIKNRKLSKWQGIAGLGLYLIYFIYLLMNAF